MSSKLSKTLKKKTIEDGNLYSSLPGNKAALLILLANRLSCYCRTKRIKLSNSNEKLSLVCSTRSAHIYSHAARSILKSESACYKHCQISLGYISLDNTPESGAQRIQI